MSTPKVVVKEREVRLARAFLHAINGDEKNGYLLLAVIAWQRLMGKAHDPFWKSLAHLGAKSAGIALARKLRARMHAHPDEYKGLSALLKRRGGKDATQVEAAQSFMLIIEKSKWDAKHYGYVEGKDGYFEVSYYQGEPHYTWVPPVLPRDPMADAWASITGHPIPPKWFNDPVTVTTVKPHTDPPRPSQPRSLEHVMPRPEYIQPYAALHFYEERPHFGANVLPTD